MTKFRKTVIKITALVGAMSFASGFLVDSFGGTEKVSVATAEAWRKFNATIDARISDFFDSDVVYKISDTVAQDEEISVIVSMNTESVMDAYKSKDREETVSEYAQSGEAKKVERAVQSKQRELIKKLNKSGIDYELGSFYDTILSGFEVIIQAKDYEKLGETLGASADLIVGETYERAATTKIVTNEVIVDDRTGIFDGTTSGYTGDGVVVAVLDSGLDYTHSAFDVKNFEAKNPAFTLETIKGEVENTVAAGFTAGLKGEDVYVNEKIPFAYDYADKDTDVLPTNSDHGTHVSGIIAGSNNEITGVAPDAQIAFMKVFSDSQDSAKTSWILAGLEDCVVLGVDVINMSLGSACGFTEDRGNKNSQKINDLYNSVELAGISLIVAAANDYNSTHGSEKNGALGLTKHPDSGTVGSPSTFDAALSVASVDGVRTPYLKYGENVIYFNEATDASAQTKHFVDDILATVGDGVESHEFDYVTIPGLGRASDYTEPDEFYQGKIVLVKRGTISFEDKIKVAIREKGAAGIIIYNNVSGTINMSVGKVKNAACCSISQDNGEMLAAQGSGKILISKEQTAGPFMSEFSSWGPTSDLKIKPEITAHGGEIYSCIPGEAYERQSGTSMAAPNQAGATALIREYVKYSGIFGSDLANPVNARKVTTIVNQLMMSTTDIVLNKDGLPYAVRKQGSGLVNITKATTSPAYLTTYDIDGNKMTKTKFELGDDKDCTGVYEMKFDINNIGDSALSYLVDGKILTEGVSETYTSHDDTTVTQEGYLLDGAKTTVLSVSGAGTKNGNEVFVEANGVATVTVRVELSDEDKKYIEDNFENGMYVEGFITLTAKSGTSVNLNAPLLAYYGDWTKAPIFDEEYYDTHADEINNGIDPEDKLMADAYATRVFGSLYGEYITTMGSYYFIQNPSATQISAKKEYISLSNQTDEASATINAIYSVSAGLLRNVREMQISITEDATGKEIWSATEYNVTKSRSYGSSMYGSSIEMDFDALKYNLKNNTKYTVTFTAYIDYGENSEQKNVRNVFEFPLYIDLEAPTVTDISYRTEYNATTKKTRLFADLYIYDNHYAQAVQFGQITYSGEAFELGTFGKYITPVYSSFNSTSKVSVELTDYIADLKKSATVKTEANGEMQIVQNSNTFVAMCYDYAMNSAVYEFELPDEILSLNFTQDELKLSPNETKDLGAMLQVFPAESWLQLLDFESDNPDVVDVINRTAIAKASGTATIKVTGYTENGTKVEEYLPVTVLAPGDAGYNGGYTVPKVNKFSLDGYTVNKAYYSVNTDEREIGLTGGTYEFGGVYKLSMFPSENVTINTTLDSYFMDHTKITYQSSNKKVATVNEKGEIEAVSEGTARIMVSVTYDGSATAYSGTITVTVKDPFTTNSLYLMSYKGLGGVVEIPNDRGITTIYSYAFSNYEYVAKGPGDVIDEEDPYTVKQAYIGEDTITKVIIPEGVTTINSYAFAGLTALEEVVLPKSLTRIGVGAFLGCTKLKTINLDSVKFINSRAFENCALTGTLDLTGKVVNGEKVGDVLVAISDYAFKGCKLTSIKLPKTAQSLGIGAFYQNNQLTSVEFQAPKVKIGTYAFAYCKKLLSININASVISARAFYQCAELKSAELGKDVAIIGEYAFAGTAIEKFALDFRNETFSTEDGTVLYRGTELALVAPKYSAVSLETDIATSIATGAFAGNKVITRVVAPNVTKVGDYAFAGCTRLDSFESGQLTEIGSNAFENTALATTPDLSQVTWIGDSAFRSTDVKTVSIASGTNVGSYAFAYCSSLAKVEIGSNVSIGDYAFYSNRSWNLVEGNDTIDNFKYYLESEYKVMEGDKVVKIYKQYSYDLSKGIYSSLKEVTVGEGSTLGSYAFAENALMETLVLLGDVKIGDYAFYNVTSLKNVDLSQVDSIGAYAFSGKQIQDLMLDEEARTYFMAADYYSVDGKITANQPFYTNAAPKISEVNLTNITSLGSNVFENNTALKTVSFGDKLTAIPDYAFAGTSIFSLALTDKITSIGANAFKGVGIESVDLTSVENVGERAFFMTTLKEVSLKDSAIVGAYAFANSEKLATVNGLGNLKKIGESAFAGTAIENVSFVKVEELGDFAFADSALKTVEFKTNTLTFIGENPFANCEIKSFATVVDVLDGVGAVVSTKIVDTYDISDKVKVINDVIYQVELKGLRLVSYPMGKDATSYTLEDSTVRISARAFEGSALQNVTLSSKLSAIGHKAFYACDDLKVVVFKSYQAPMLEEEYDASLVNFENLPFSGWMEKYEGLGIVDFYMWNIAASPNAFFFGANFENYIGHCSGDLVMVKPNNGKNYDTFIFNQYFGTVVNGSTAAMDSTLNVIALIAKLPSNITLSAEAMVVEARKAYDAIGSLDQKALVSNYETLKNAESLISYLKNKQPVVVPDNPIVDNPSDSAFATFLKNNAIGLALAGVVALAFVAYVCAQKGVFAKLVVLLKKTNVAKETVELEETQTVVESEDTEEEN